MLCLFFSEDTGSLNLEGDKLKENPEEKPKEKPEGDHEEMPAGPTGDG